nr:pantetheine-phosphate adenylyltransferase [Prevotella sp.]
MQRIGLFTGTFDPFTIGHQNIVERVSPLFDKIIIAVALSKLKNTEEEISKRIAEISTLYKDDDKVEVRAYSDLTVDMAKREKADYIIRGVRSVKDFEYEREQADINKQLSGIETILLFSEPQYGSISSTLVRELRFFGKEASQFLPKKK